MEYQGSSQIDLKEIRGNHFDLIIAASGYESRSITLFQNNFFSASKKVAFAFTERPNESIRKNNDGFFLSQGFELISISGEDSSFINTFLENFFGGINKSDVSVLIDYSSMTRTWYAAIISFMITNVLDFQNISIYFSYTPAGFNLPKKAGPVRIASSIISHKTSRSPDKPLALVIGLGIEPAKAEYLVRKLEPSELILMYADPAFEKKYVETVLKRNRKLIERVEIRKMLNYPLSNIEVINEILTNLCLILRIKYNVIIAPVGPKVFSLCSLLMSAVYPDIDVWRVSSGAGDPVYDRIPIKDPIIINARFVDEESDS